MKRIFSIFLLSMSFCSNAQIISTYVGTGVLGFSGDDSLSTIAEIGYPSGLFIDNNNNLLVCHQDFVRKVDRRTSIITSLAGSDTASSLGGGGDGGLATCAEVVAPIALCVDALGNLYIADQWFSEIRKVNISTGIIDTFAGCRLVGSSGDGGQAKNARFNTISGVCIDTILGYLYISDAYNYRVRRVDIASGIITDFAGTGTSGYSGDGGAATAAKLSRTLGICIDQHHNVYIGDWDNGAIRKVDAYGNISTYAGYGSVGYSGDGGLATAAKLSKSSALCIDSLGNLYFTDENNERVRKIDAHSKIITTIAGDGIVGFSGDGMPATSCEFNHPDGIAIDNDGYIYISDYNNQRVRIIKPSVTNYANEIPSLVDEISIFPNPATSEIFVSSHDKINSIEIVNFVGQTVFKNEYDENNVGISVNMFAPGIYYAKVYNNSEKIEVKIFTKN